MIDAVMIMGGLGLVVGAGLAAASKIFYVYVDPKIEAVDDVLPGANCGGCGYPGCTSNAEAIVAGKSPANSCVAAGDETAEAIAVIMGLSLEAKEPDIARPGCTYGMEKADVKFVYDGISDCRAATLLNGGMKICDIGCIGLGSCEKACQFGAVAIGENGLPVVDEKKCTGCGACERACPKHIITLSSVTRRIMREYTTDDCTTPCQRSCPAGIDICEYIHQISLGEYHRAVQVIKERNPFPTVIGRICPRPCEDDCRRQYVDQPVAINFLKRFAADYEREKGARVQPFKAPATDRNVAVIGGGVAGLSSAFFLARLGHSPTVYETRSQLGGLLRTAIARNRLGMDILDWDIDGILDMGVKTETGQMLGKDIHIDQLLADGHEAVFLATGGWDSRLGRAAIDQPETPVPGVFLLIEYLKAIKNKSAAIKPHRHTLIAGGGKLAVDAARLSRENGAAGVTILYRETRETLDSGTAIDREALQDEGITVEFGVGINTLAGCGRQLASVGIIDLKTGEKRTIEAGTLMLATGRFPQLVFMPAARHSDNKEAALQPVGNIAWEAFEVYKRPDLNKSSGFFAEGDEISDFSGAIRAIGAGRRAAAAIHQTMYDIPVTLPADVVNTKTRVQNVDKVHLVPVRERQIMPLADAEALAGGAEIETGFTEATARKEAKRCLQCGLICYRKFPGTVAAENEPENDTEKRLAANGN